jgi:hypothetical protein
MLYVVLHNILVTTKRDPMNALTPTASDKFSFGLWTIG